MAMALLMVEKAISTIKETNPYKTKQINLALTYLLL
jgi:hypothetical protein